MAKRKKKKFGPLYIGGLVREAIQQAVTNALKAKPVVLKTTSSEHACFEIKGVVYDEQAALEEILGKYTWWTG